MTSREHTRTLSRAGFLRPTSERVVFSAPRRATARLQSQLAPELKSNFIPAVPGALRSRSFLPLREYNRRAHTFPPNDLARRFGAARRVSADGRRENVVIAWLKKSSPHREPNLDASLRRATFDLPPCRASRVPIHPHPRINGPEYVRR